jgi:hypothetical protein
MAEEWGNLHVRNERDDQLEQLRMKIPFRKNRSKTCRTCPISEGNPDRISETFAIRRGEKVRADDLPLQNLINNEDPLKN